MGAIQNRLESAVASLSNTSENLTKAESGIRDADMAEQMSIYTKNNILAQAGQSMLSQANKSPESVLALIG